MKRLDRAPPRSNKAKRKLLAAQRRRDGGVAARTSIEVARQQKAEAKRAATAKLAAARRNTRNPRATLERLRRGERVALPDHSPLKAVAAVYGLARHGAPFRRPDVLDALHRLALAGLRERLFQSSDLPSVALLNASRLHRDWLRAPEDWRPRSKNPRKQLSSLLRHLFARYEVPLLFDQAFRRNNTLHQRWFLHLGAGQNLRTAPGLPTTLTKKMAHLALQAPSGTLIPSALRWGQALAFGCSPGAAAAVMGTQLCHASSFEDDAFWVAVIRFFGRFPLLDPEHYGPIVDYLAHARRERPTLSLKGWTPKSLLDRVEAWHRQLGWERRGDDLWQRPLGLLDLEFTPPDPADPAQPGPVTWTVVPLLSSAALRDEGRALRHCVATYASSCVSGRTSIWSLRQVTAKRTSSECTIEVRHRAHGGPDPEVVQVRGKRNAIPDRERWLVVERWLRRNGLQVASWVPRS